jgi:spore germination protein KB
VEKISNYQLLSLTILYQIGTTTIFGFATDAGRAAWISVLISTVIGVSLNLIYLKLMDLNPGLTFVQWFPKQFGKWIGTPIAWMYILQLLYVGGRIIGDLRSLIPNILLPKTPHPVTSAVLLVVVTYALYSGIENIGRLGEIFFPILFIITALLIILLFFSDVINLQYIKPYLGDGWKVIWKAVWPLGITQTFGQTIEFAMIWPLVNQPDKVKKTVVQATIISGLYIAIVDLLAVLGLGETIFKRSIFPAFRLTRLIGVGDFIQNLDALNVLLFLVAAFFKLCMHLYNAIRGIQQLTYAKSSRTFIIPAVLIVFYLGLYMAKNSTEHIEAGLKIMPYNLWLPLFLILPIILLIVSLIRSGIEKRRDKPI